MLEHQNEHFVRDFLQFSHYVASIFLRVFLWTSRFATSNLMFHARPPLIFSTSHKMPRPPCNLHLVTTWRSPDNAIRKKHATRKMTMKVVKVVRRLPRKLQLIWWKRCKSIAPATQNDYRHVMKHVSTVTKCQSATRNEATQHWKPPKRTTFAELAIGTAIRGSRDPPANGCDRKRNVEQTHPQPPDPQTPRVKREPLLRIRENSEVSEPHICPEALMKIADPIEHDNNVLPDYVSYAVSRRKINF